MKDGERRDLLEEQADLLAIRAGLLRRLNRIERRMDFIKGELRRETEPEFDFSLGGNN